MPSEQLEAVINVENDFLNSGRAAIVVRINDGVDKAYFIEGDNKVSANYHFHLVQLTASGYRLNFEFMEH